MFVYLPVYLYVCLYVCLYLCICLHNCLPVFLSICLSVCLSISLSVYQSVCLFACLSHHLCADWMPMKSYIACSIKISRSFCCIFLWSTTGTTLINENSFLFCLYQSFSLSVCLTPFLPLSLSLCRSLSLSLSFSLSLFWSVTSSLFRSKKHRPISWDRMM